MNTDNIMDPSTVRTIKAAARRWKSKCWWVDEGDLFGWGVQVVLEAARTYREERGDWPRYYRSALRRGLWRRILRESAPVSATDHQLRELTGLTRAPLEKINHMSTNANWADEVLEDKRWRRRVSKLLQQVVRHKVQENGHPALAVLLGADYRDVAKTYKLPQSEVRAAVLEVEDAVKKSRHLLELLRQRC